MKIKHQLREIHLDCQRLGISDRSQLLALGFFDDHFVKAGGGLELPPYHLTWQIEGEKQFVSKEQQLVLNQARAIISKSSDFVGYLECEIINPEFVATIPARPFELNKTFPIPRTQQETTVQNKLSDLHIKIPIKFLTSDLESLFEEAGIYFVETPKGNRIYTLQFLSHQEGRAGYRETSKFFKACGGATEVTYEVCSLFVRKPENLPAPSVVIKGSLLPHLCVIPDREFEGKTEV